MPQVSGLSSYFLKISLVIALNWVNVVFASVPLSAAAQVLLTLLHLAVKWSVGLKRSEWKSPALLF